MFVSTPGRSGLFFNGERRSVDREAPSGDDGEQVGALEGYDIGEDFPGEPTDEPTD